MRAIVLMILVGCAGIKTADVRDRQYIARTMAACMGQTLAQEHNGIMLDCTCEAQRACLEVGQNKTCAWDDWQLETAGHYGSIAGKCPAYNLVVVRK